MQEKTLQEKIKECLPPERNGKLPDDLIVFEDRISDYQFGYNTCLSDVHSSLPKVLEVIRKAIEEMEEYSLGDDSANVGYMYCKKDIINLLK